MIIKNETDMKEYTIYYPYIATLIWMIIMTLIFIFLRTEKIKAIGDFFAKILPKIPLSDIIRALRGK